MMGQIAIGIHLALVLIAGFQQVGRGALPSALGRQVCTTTATLKLVARPRMIKEVRIGQPLPAGPRISLEAEQQTRLVLVEAVLAKGTRVEGMVAIAVEALQEVRPYCKDEKLYCTISGSAGLPPARD